ncbi:MAG: hypothetical protein WBV06_13665 [Acidimicrobiia bacterium]
MDRATVGRGRRNVSPNTALPDSMRDDLIAQLDPYVISRRLGHA